MTLGVMRIVRRTETVAGPDAVGQQAGATSSWWELARCRAWDADLFCVPEGVTPTRKRAQEAKAKRICGTCPVRERCLDEAMARDEQLGVWGGLDTDERRALERSRRGPRRSS